MYKYSWRLSELTALSRKFLIGAVLQEFAGVLLLPVPPWGSPSLRAPSHPAARFASAPPPGAGRRSRGVEQCRSTCLPALINLSYKEKEVIDSGPEAVELRRGRGGENFWARGPSGAGSPAAGGPLVLSASDSSGHGGWGEDGASPVCSQDSEKAQPSLIQTAHGSRALALRAG